MKRVLMALFLAGTFFMPGKIVAQGEDEMLVVLISRDKAKAEIMELFKATESGYLHEVHSPRFLLIDKKHRYALGIGGYVSFRTTMDFKGAVNNTDFVPAMISVPGRSVNNGHTFMDASTSRIFLKLVGNNRFLGNFTTYIETDFRGANNTLRLRQAYVAFRGFTLGQTWSTFSDLEALPPTVDFEGPCGNTAIRTLQARYTYRFDKHWEIAGALENPSLSAIYNAETQSTYQRMPDIPLYVQYSWGASHVRASGLLRGMSYHDNLTDTNEMKLGWGVQLSGAVNLLPKLKGYFQTTYGEGLGMYVSDFTYLNGYDLAPNNHKPGHMEAVKAFAFYGGLQWNMCSKFYISATYSQSRAYSRDDNFSGDNYRYGQYIVANAFYNLTANCFVGLEYLHGRRVNFDSENGTANRLQAMIQYNF